MDTQRRQIEEGTRKLAELDPVMRDLIARHGIIMREPRADYFMSLSRAIIGQQLSVKAAASIFERFQLLTELKPQGVLAADPLQLRETGLSGAKTRYIQDLAAHFAADPAVYSHLEALPDEEVIQELTRVKGIGIWTAQMFLMFTLVRPDVFAADDVGLQNAMLKLYAWPARPTKIDLLAAADKWRPYRTIASWHLWESLKNEPGL